MAPSLLPLAAQAVALSVMSSLLAQLLTAYRQGTSPLPLNWDPVLEFALYTALTNPLNVLWQDFLERCFPSAPATPTPEKPASPQPSPTPALPPALTKTLLDQSVGACANTLLFCLFVGWWDAPAATAGWTTAQAAAARARTGFVPLLLAGWRFWPAVSLGSYVLVRDVGTRSLVGGLAGVAWGVYVSLREG